MRTYTPPGAAAAAAADDDDDEQELVKYYYSTFDSNRSGLQALYRDASLMTWMGEQVRSRAVRRASPRTHAARGTVAVVGGPLLACARASAAGGAGV